MKKKKKPESIERFMARRNKKETGKFTIPETKPSPHDSSGSHKTIAKQYHVGVTKKRTAKKLERMVKKKKKHGLAGVFQ
jgi:hypothetical protein